MKNFVLRKGHNLIIDGNPSNSIIETSNSSSILIHPVSIKNIKVKLLVKEGDRINIGTPLFYDKKDDKVLFVSSCSGIVKEIVFGSRRIVETIKLENDYKNNRESLSNVVNKDNLLKSGLWTFIRQKPYSKIPLSSSMPKSIFISSMPTEPFAINNDFLFDKFIYLQNGIDVLKQIFQCDINLTIGPNSKFANLKDVNYYQFNKLHPSGNVGIQIHHVDPIENSNDSRWYLSIQDLNRIGEFFNTGNYPNSKYLSVGGNGSTKPSIYKIILGTPINHIQDSINCESSRVISGDVLSGKEVRKDAAVNYHDEVLSIIKTNDSKNFLGWIMPGFKKYSLTNTFMSRFFSNKKSILTTKKNGSIRTIIPMGNWDNVLPMDILSEFLVKSILANDIDMMEKLGIYECSPEDFALCSFVCQSKVEVSAIIEKGLDAMEAEE